MPAGCRFGAIHTTPPWLVPVPNGWDKCSEYVTQVVIIHVEQGCMHIDEGYVDTEVERGGPHLGPR